MARTVEEQLGVPERETPEITPPPAPAETAPRPEWLPENFSKPEDLLRSYEESRAEMARAQQRAAAAEESANELAQRLGELEQRAYQQPQQNGQQQPDPWLVAEAQAWEEGDTLRALQMRDIRTAQMVQAGHQLAQPQQDPAQEDALNQMFVIQTENLVASHYGDEWDSLRGPVAELLEQHPHLVPNTRDPQAAAESIALVADMVRSQKLAEQTAGQAQAAQSKRLAQTAQGGSARQGSARTAEEAWIERLKQVGPAYR